MVGDAFLPDLTAEGRTRPHLAFSDSYSDFSSAPSSFCSGDSSGLQ
jgi:hypothetical protein